MWRNGNVSKHGSISLLKRSESKTNNSRPSKVRTRGRKVCQVPFIGVQKLPKPTRKQRGRRKSKALPTTSFKHVLMARNMRSGNLRWGPKRLTRTKQPWLSLFKDRGPLAICQRKSAAWPRIAVKGNSRVCLLPPHRNGFFINEWMCMLRKQFPSVTNNF